MNASFERIRKALDLREKLLLRQLSVVVQQSHHVTFQFDNIKFVDGGEEDLIGRIRTYGKYNIDNFNIILKDPYENEDYIQPVDDHDLMHKSCRRGASDEERDNPESEEIVVEFFSNKSLIKEGAEMVRESIINLALNESKELIDKSFGGANVGFELDEELERMKIDLTNFRNRERTVTDSLSSQGEGGSATVDISNNNNITSNQGDGLGIDLTRVARQQLQHMITKASQTELDKAGRHNSSISATSSETDRSLVVKGSSKNAEKNLKNVSALTMNNCGGTINLKNVTNLTINTCAETPPLKTADNNPPAPRCPSEEGSPECGFYKRLITENKILRQHILKTSLANATAPVPNSQSSTSSTSESPKSEPSATVNSSSSSASDCKSQRLPLTAAELRAVLNLPQHDDTLTQVLGDLFALASPTTATAATAGAMGTAEPTSQEHTMQIQQWLKQIISETETEPLQNAEMMEFSHINN